MIISDAQLDRIFVRQEILNKSKKEPDHADVK